MGLCDVTAALFERTNGGAFGRDLFCVALRVVAHRCGERVGHVAFLTCHWGRRYVVLADEGCQDVSDFIHCVSLTLLEQRYFTWGIELTVVHTDRAQDAGDVAVYGPVGLDVQVQGDVALHRGQFFPDRWCNVFVEVDVAVVSTTGIYDCGCEAQSLG